MSSETILVVEDEAIIRWAWAQDLIDAGFAVREAGTGDEALDILVSEQRVDALVTDIRMPGFVDGWTLAERAREDRRELPVIYTTGFSPDHARQVPGSVLLTKPMPTNAIIDALAGFGLPSAGWA